MPPKGDKSSSDLVAERRSGRRGRIAARIGRTPGGCRGLAALFRHAPRDHIKATHTYRIGGQLKRTEKWLTEPTAYAIECSAEPENVSVKLEAPHGEQ